MKLQYFIITWIIGCIIFPFWLIFNNAKLSFMFYLILLIYFGFGIYLLYRWFNNKTTKNIDFSKINKYLIWTLIIAFISQLYALTFTIVSRGDEFYHINRGINIFQPLHNLLGNYVFILGWLLLLLIILIVKFRDKLELYFDNLKNKIGIKSLTIISIFIALIYFFFVTKYSSGLLAQTSGDLSDHLQWLVRYSPLPALISGFELSLFGYQEFALRLASLAFYLLAGYFLYKLVCLYRDEKTATIAAALLLFFPSFFYYGHSALLESGLVALMLASSYYFLKYMKENSINDGLTAFLLFDLAFLYKNPALALLPVFWLIIFAKNFNSVIKLDFKKLYEPLKLTIISLIVVLPWIVITQIYAKRVYEFAASLDFTAYLKLLPDQITLPLAILFFGALIYGLFKQDELSIFSLSLFAIFYIVFSFETAAGAGRLVIPYLPAIAILISQLIVLIDKKYLNFLMLLIPIYLLVSSLSLTYINHEDYFLPVDKAANYIKYNIPSDEKILAPIHGIPYKFYTNKYGDNINRYVTEINQQTITDLNNYLKNNKISYILMPTDGVMSNNEYGFGELWWGNNYINRELVNDMLKENPYFSVENVFISGQNKMVLWKVT